MGCATSRLPSAKAAVGVMNGDVHDEQELALLTAAPPRINLITGSGVRHFQDDGHNIVFVFGGPFSMKGLLVEELVAAFDFTVVTTEDIILSYLPNKVANTVQTTQEIKDLLQTDPNMLSLEWVLNLASARLTTNSHRLFIIDIVPNMHTILRMETFNKPDVRREMTDFERRFPVMFALNLIVSEDNIATSNVAPGIAMKINRPVSGSGSGDDDEVTTNDKEKDKDKDKKDLFEGSDEMDTSRMKKRYDLYQSCADPFISYFESTKRVVTVHVTPLQKEYVWRRLFGYFRECGFQTQKLTRSVVLFVLNEQQVEGLDILYYKMLKISLSAIISNKNDTMENMIKAIALYVRRSGSSSQNHLVILDCLNTRTEMLHHRRIKFLEIRECYLDHYIRIKSTSVKSKPFKKRFKSITTTTNEVCLFPADEPDLERPGMDTDLCKKIAYYFAMPDNNIGNGSASNHSAKSNYNQSCSSKQTTLVEDENRVLDANLVSTVTTVG